MTGDIAPVSSMSGSNWPRYPYGVISTTMVQGRKKAALVCPAPSRKQHHGAISNQRCHGR